jgi:hypothetical protein
MGSCGIRTPVIKISPAFMVSERLAHFYSINILLLYTAIFIEFIFIIKKPFVCANFLLWSQTCWLLKILHSHVDLWSICSCRVRNFAFLLARTL